MSIKDSGIGLPENFNIKNSSGLDSALVNSLVQQIDGELDIKTENGTEYNINFQNK